MVDEGGFVMRPSSWVLGAWGDGDGCEPWYNGMPGGWLTACEAIADEIEDFPGYIDLLDDPENWARTSAQVASSSMGLDRAVLADWHGHGFEESEVLVWIGHGVCSAEEALKWKSVGYSTEKLPEFGRRAAIAATKRKKVLALEGLMPNESPPENA